MSTLNTDGSPKSFWERKEGTWGIGVIAALGLGGLVIGNLLLPSIIAFLGMAITAVGQGIVLAALCALVALGYAVVSNGTIQAVVGYAFKSGVRAFANQFVTIDPIGIMKNYIDDLKENLRKIDKGIEDLSGQVTICRRKVDANAQAADQALTTAKVARDKNMQAQFSINSRQAGRLEKSNVTLKELLATMELHLRAMKKYREVSETVVGDMQNEVEVREDERKLILKSYNVMQSAKRILNGDPDKKQLFDQAMDFVVDDYGQKLGEIENFIATSQNFVEGLDLQNGVYEEDALKKIHEWESRADSILLGDTKKQMVESATLTRIPQLPPVTSTAVDTSYDNLFKK